MLVNVIVKQSPTSGRWYVRAVDPEGKAIITDSYRSEATARAEAKIMQDWFDEQAEADELFAEPTDEELRREVVNLRDFVAKLTA